MQYSGKLLFNSDSSGLLYYSAHLAYRRFPFLAKCVYSHSLVRCFCSKDLPLVVDWCILLDEYLDSVVFLLSCTRDLCSVVHSLYSLTMPYSPAVLINTVQFVCVGVMRNKLIPIILCSIVVRSLEGPRRQARMGITIRTIVHQFILCASLSKVKSSFSDRDHPFYSLHGIPVQKTQMLAVSSAQIFDHA